MTDYDYPDYKAQIEELKQSLNRLKEMAKQIDIKLGELNDNR